MTQRTPLIAGNWKMFKTDEEARQTARHLVEITTGTTGRDIMIAPPFTALVPVYQAIRESRLRLGAQNLYWEPEGAFTGEISPTMLTAAGCRYVIIGHSERRHLFGETDAGVNKKIEAAAAAGLMPVMCIGETEAERDEQKTFSVLDKQIKNGLQGIASDRLEHLVIAYEPVWAIGTGKTATRDQAQEAHAFVRSVVAEMFDEPFAAARRILYGGSVKPGNIAELMAMADIDGALVGGASLDAETFGQIINF